MLINLTREVLQSLNLLDHLLVVDEIPLMEIVEFIQEELHVACLFGQNQATLPFCDSIATPKVLKSPVCNRIVFNIIQCKRHGCPLRRIIGTNSLEIKARKGPCFLLYIPVCHFSYETDLRQYYSTFDRSGKIAPHGSLSLRACLRVQLAVTSSVKADTFSFRPYRMSK